MYSDCNILLFQEEIERLRKEGSREVEEEIEFVKRQLRQENNLNSQYWDGSKHRIKIKWTSSKNDNSNGGYSEDLLHQFLSKVGNLMIFFSMTLLNTKINRWFRSLRRYSDDPKHYWQIFSGMMIK